MTQERQDDDVKAAQSGDAVALDRVVRGIQDQVYRLARRMLFDADAAEEATQEILIRIVTKLSTFKGQSGFDTWVYRVAVNYLLSARKAIARDPGLNFSAFSDDLLEGLVDENTQSPEDHVMLNELRINCTMAMLLCLDRDHRMAYVLGEVLEFDHSEAAEVLKVSPANFRKRLSRARSEVVAFTAKTCGLANPAARCSCRKRLPAAMASGRIGTAPAQYWVNAPEIVAVRQVAERTQAELVAAKLQRATGPLNAPGDIAAGVMRIVDPPD